MKHYFIVKRQQLMFDSPYTTHWCAAGTQPHTIGLHPIEHADEEVVVWAKFADEGLYQLFLQQDGVESLGDPFEPDEISDEHMERLKRFHGHEPIHTADKIMWQHKHTKKLLDRKPHVRGMAKIIAQEQPSFVFRIF